MAPGDNHPLPPSRNTPPPPLHMQGGPSRYHHLHLAPVRLWHPPRRLLVSCESPVWGGYGPILPPHGSCTLCDWDESDAYVRVVREEVHHLLCCLPHVWDYSTWAHKVYSRPVIESSPEKDSPPPSA